MKRSINACVLGKDAAALDCLISERRMSLQVPFGGSWRVDFHAIHLELGPAPQICDHRGAAHSCWRVLCRRWVLFHGLLMIQGFFWAIGCHADWLTDNYFSSPLFFPHACTKSTFNCLLSGACAVLITRVNQELPNFNSSCRGEWAEAVVEWHTHSQSTRRGLRLQHGHRPSRITARSSGGALFIVCLLMGQIHITMITFTAACWAILLF